METTTGGGELEQIIPVTLDSPGHPRYPFGYTDTHLLLLLCVVGLPLHGGEADVELLDDRGVQAVEVQQQHKLVVKTYNMTQGQVRFTQTHTHTQAKLNKFYTKNALTNFWIQHQTSSVGCLLLPLAFPCIYIFFPIDLGKQERA